MKWEQLVFLFVSTYAVATMATKKNNMQCRYLDQSSFKNCAGEQRKEEMKTLRGKYNIQMNASQSSCAAPSPCQQLYQTARVRVTFAISMSYQIASILDRCCGGCSRYNETVLREDTNHLAYFSDNHFLDIIYPIYSSRSLVGSVGFYFIPVFDLPTSYYITPKKTEREMAEEVIMSCINMWPLLIICALMSLIAGFFIWLFDTWSNQEQFPRPIISGVCEGFWCAFVSMTTVGYGDRAPKSLPARCFTILWLLVGMTICSIYVASIATAIMDMENPETPDLRGQTVGALKGRTHDLLTIAQEGGQALQAEGNNTITGIDQLLRMMDAKTIDGILLSRVTYFYYCHKIKNTPNLRHLKRDFILTEKNLEGQDLVGGIVLRKFEDYNFFKRYFEMNWAYLQGCNAFNMNHHQVELKDLEGNVLQGLFLPFLYGIFAILGVIGIFGAVYETRRIKKDNELARDISYKE